MPNPNHPLKGSRIAVDPIKRVEDIESIKRLLTNQPRDLLLFTIGINNGLRTGDLLRLKVGQVRMLKPGSSLIIREGKTGKANILMINKPIHQALRKHLELSDLKDDDYLFKSRKGRNQPLSIQRVNQLIKSWCAAINLAGNYGAHSLRKTFGYIQRSKFGVGFELLCKRFNHSSPAITMRYLGVEDSEICKILLHEL